MSRIVGRAAGTAYDVPAYSLHGLLDWSFPGRASQGQPARSRNILRHMNLRIYAHVLRVLSYQRRQFATVPPDGHQSDKILTYRDSSIISKYEFLPTPHGSGRSHRVGQLVSQVMQVIYVPNGKSAKCPVLRISDVAMVFKVFFSRVFNSAFATSPVRVTSSAAP
jgi:hypothetical protein